MTRLVRLLLCPAVVLACATATSAQEPPPMPDNLDAAVARGLESLAKRQNPDGSFGGEEHGLPIHAWASWVTTGSGPLAPVAGAGSFAGRLNNRAIIPGIPAMPFGKNNTARINKTPRIISHRSG